MNIQDYLKRINYRGSIVPSAQTLRDLQLAHLQAVPFENLSIHANQPIVLNDKALFEKIVKRRRGGFCYELNGLFAALLRELGFKVDMLSARVANAQGELGPEFDHMTLLVSLEDRWLADVGFGDSFLLPLLLDERGEQVQGNVSYQILAEDDGFSLMQRNPDDQWRLQYRFTLKPYTFSAYEAMCRYHQTSPESHFTSGRVCTRATPQGRITLRELRLITTTQGQREERSVADELEYEKILREEFDVVVALRSPNSFCG